MITYKETQSGLSVFVGNQKTGTIKKSNDGWWYYIPMGSNMRGEHFNTLE